MMGLYNIIATGYVYAAPITGVTRRNHDDANSSRIYIMIVGKDSVADMTHEVTKTLILIVAIVQSLITY